MIDQTVRIFDVNERARGDYSFEIRDRNGIAVPGSVVTSARLSVYLTSEVPANLKFVNGRNAQNVLQTNNVTISETGVVKWDIQSGDMAIIINNSAQYDPRIAVFEITWPQGLILHEVAFNVRNVPNI
jgi:hypothetical protein